ncbi:1-phosphofructokinase [Bovifimicola ammoniilytica]|jgi:1-phosphofructokinase|uniref:1-phosphofructokinase n=1 Tax=Bovifimicola ammoniilytica TaxID=2981720 RepID=UPI0003355FE5|nr:1-phosphofructokinase [Bovifimicola ammoniilytica]MCU6753530.1 1-phosphofructokinase [Bovifimicola ammoniilytica]CCZ03222.1 fructose-1-phosphate kinase [Eubacterium sp. CAG:603]SCJ66165.1 Tagatose-6-phosphate kinase [uncultured Eubacterium sp.]
MIYTVTFNPSLDYIVSVRNFEEGSVNRVSDEMILPGGKGINVSIVLNNLGMESHLLGFIAGFTGKEIERMVSDDGCISEFIKVDNGFSRINVKMRSEKESEINGIGPAISNSEMTQLLDKLDKLKEGDVLVLAGSIPASIPDTIYYDIMKMLSDRKIMIVVDATKDLLLNVLPLHPFLIKPNKQELAEMMNLENLSKEDIVKNAFELQKRGARNVLVSMAGEGAILVTEDGNVYSSAAHKGNVVNSVGAGDSMVAGFIYGYLKNKDYKEAFETGLCAGSASAFSENLATKEQVEELLIKQREMTVE